MMTTLLGIISRWAETGMRLIGLPLALGNFINLYAGISAIASGLILNITL